MGRIIFTDGIGQAVLHNGKPAPSNRFSNWTPHPLPFGDKANRQSDAALTMIRLRDDFRATFDLTGIPVLAQKTNLIEIVGDITGTAGATPTSMLVGAPSTVAVTLVGSLVGSIGYNNLIAKHTFGSPGTAIGYFNFSAANAHHLTGSNWVYIPSAASLTNLTLGWEAGGTGTVGSVVTATADLTKRDQWQQLVSTATVTGTGDVNIVLRITSAASPVLYSDAWSITDADDGLTTRMVDVADRLAYHLENGGTCEVDTGDFDGNIYATCGLAPGASASPPVLSDKKNLEYTLSLNLVNLAGSPARMRCHYI